MDTESSIFSLNARACVRCAACSTAAPEIFEVSRKGSRLVRQPQDDAERSACSAAAELCPTRAIVGAAAQPLEGSDA